MKIYPGPVYKRKVKKLSKKYRTFPKDIGNFLRSLHKNPITGTALGYGLYKTLLAISETNRGKSSGARIITHVDIVTHSNEQLARVDLITVYDKATTANVTLRELRSMVSDAVAIREEE